MTLQKFLRVKIERSAAVAKQLICIVACITPFLSAGQQLNQINVPGSSVNAATFQEIGFFGDVKKEQWPAFLQAVQHNISQSRLEPHNISFSLYQPENGKLQPIWFERFKDKAAHRYHKEQSYFKNAISVINQSLKGPAKSITLKVLEELPVTAPLKAVQLANTRYIIVLFHVLPEKRKAFVNAMAGAAPAFRSTVGNLEFNLYAYADEPNKFVLIEGWQNTASHEAQLKQGHIKQLNSAIKGMFVSNPINSRWVVKDISQ